jgi:pheromone shutdown protein TraB
LALHRGQSALGLSAKHPKGAMPDISQRRIEQETALLERQRRAGVMITVGKVLLWMDLILACFVYVGLKSGSHFFLWWVIAEGVLGFALLGVGSQKRSEVNRILAELSPTAGDQDVPDEAEQQRRAS